MSEQHKYHNIQTYQNITFIGKKQKNKKQAAAYHHYVKTTKTVLNLSFQSWHIIDHIQLVILFYS